MNKNLGIKNMVLTALMTALTYIFTVVIRIPTPGGFIHMGDFMIFISVIVLGTKRAVFASGIGMFLVNILGSYILWAPFTLIIKSTMALITGTIIERIGNKEMKTCFIAFTIGSIFMVIAYFISGIFLAYFFIDNTVDFIGSVIFASKDIIPNIIQGSVAIVVATSVINLIPDFIKNR